MAWTIIVPFKRVDDGSLVGTDVSVPTVIQGWGTVSEMVDVLQITLVTLDPTNEANLLVEFSEDGEHPDAGTTGGAAPPLQSVTVSIGPNDLQNTYRLTASSDGPGYPSVAVAWQVKGRIAR